MQRASPVIFLLAGSLVLLPGLWAADRIALIDFYGYKAMDTEAVRRALPFHEGDPYTTQTKGQAREAVKRATGREATEIAVVCCQPSGGQAIFIGLAGESSKKVAYHAAPTGAERLSQELVSLQTRLQAAGEAAVRKGGDAIMEDDSQGYALSHDATCRSLELDVRQYALNHEDELLRVLESSSDSRHRDMAASALGYAAQSPRQVAALTHASQDPNGGVRNTATRALGVLLESNVALAKQIPVEGLIEMMSSGIWTDRNKAASVLEPMTRARDPELLAKLREQALDPLIEMARWRSEGHALGGKMILVRMAGIPESALLSNIQVDAILERLGRR